MISKEEMKPNQVNQKGTLTISIDNKLIESIKCLANKLFWPVDLFLEKILKHGKMD